MDSGRGKKSPYAASSTSHAPRLRTPWTSSTTRIPLAGRCATEEKGGGSPVTALLNNSLSTRASSMEATAMMHSPSPATDVTPLARPLRSPPYVLSIVGLEKPLNQSCMLASSLREELPAGECRAVDCPDLRLSRRGQEEEEEEVGIHEHVNYSGAHALQKPVEAGLNKVVEVEKENMKEGKEKEGAPFSILSSLSERCNNNNDEGCEYIAHRGVCVADRYELLEVLGRGTCGVVVQALDRAAQPMPELCALKISNALPRFADAAVREADILRSLPRDTAFDALPRLLNHFSMCGHEVLVLPLYGLSLKLLLRVNHFRPMPAPLVRSVAAQLIIALQALTDAGLMHTDVKPDNIVLFDHTDEPLPAAHSAHSAQEDTRAECGSGSAPSTDDSDGIACGGTEVTSRVVLVDLSSAQFVPGQPGQPVQTIGYRAPEAALGLVYGHPIDMWSLGCVVYELATGIPLFPVSDNAELLRRHIAVLGPLPEELSAAKAEADRRATADTCGHMPLDGDRPAGGTLLELLHVKDTAVPQPTAAAYADEPKNESVGDQNSSAEFSVLLMLDFLLGCLTWVPAERLTADEAARHPYLAPYFASDSGEAMGNEKTAEDLSLSSRCSGMHFLRTHALTRDAPHLLSRAKRQIDKQAFRYIATPPRLNARRSIRPMRYFTEHSDERHGSASDTALRVSVPHVGNRSCLESPSDKEPTAYTATFFDPIECVQVSILSFEDFM